MSNTKNTEFDLTQDFTPEALAKYYKYDLDKLNKIKSDIEIYRSAELSLYGNQNIRFTEGGFDNYMHLDKIEEAIEISELKTKKKNSTSEKKNNETNKLKDVPVIKMKFINDNDNEKIEYTMPDRRKFIIDSNKYDKHKINHNEIINIIMKKFLKSKGKPILKNEIINEYNKKHKNDEKKLDNESLNDTIKSAIPTKNRFKEKIVLNEKNNIEKQNLYLTLNAKLKKIN